MKDYKLEIAKDSEGRIKNTFNPLELDDNDIQDMVDCIVSLMPNENGTSIWENSFDVNRKI